MKKLIVTVLVLMCAISYAEQAPDVMSGESDRLERMFADANRQESLNSFNDNLNRIDSDIRDLNSGDE